MGQQLHAQVSGSKSWLGAQLSLWYFWAGLPYATWADDCISVWVCYFCFLKKVCLFTRGSYLFSAMKTQMKCEFGRVFLLARGLAPRCCHGSPAGLTAQRSPVSGNL